MEIKVNRNVHELFLRRPLIADALDEAAHTPPRIEFPIRGFHTLYEAQFETNDGYTVVWAWVVGGKNDGLRYTVAAARKGADAVAGWERGHKDRVFMRPIPEGLVSAIERLSPQKLLLIGELPDFDFSGYHSSSWYSNGIFALEVPPKDCLGEGAKTWHIKEGVYVSFQDGSCRLIPHREYYGMQWGQVDYRQGDLLIWVVPEWTTMALRMTDLSKDSSALKEITLDRHCITALAIKELDGPYIGVSIQGPATITHPEHETLKLPEGTFKIKLLPGTSRPFQSGID